MAKLRGGVRAQHRKSREQWDTGVRNTLPSLPSGSMDMKALSILAAIQSGDIPSALILYTYADSAGFYHVRAGTVEGRGMALTYLKHMELCDFRDMIRSADE